MSLIFVFAAMAITYLIIYYRSNRHDLNRLYQFSDPFPVSVPTKLSDEEFINRMEQNIPLLSAKGYRFLKVSRFDFIFSEGPVFFSKPPLLHLIHKEGEKLEIKTVNAASYNNKYLPKHKDRIKNLITKIA